MLSFIYVGIYWNNHHHMLHTVEEVSGRILWANLHLLFWLSLFPITTAGSQIDLTGELSCPSRRRGRVETWHTDPGLCDASFLRGDNRLEYGT